MNEENTNAEAVTDTEEAADFARVQAMIAGDTSPEAVAIAEAEAQAEPVRVDAAESMGALLGLVSAGGRMAGYHHTAELWNPEKCNELAGLVVPVARKYPWGQRLIAFFETGAGVEELALGAFAAPMIFATVGAVKADTAKPEKAAQSEPVPVPVVQVGETMREVHGHAHG